MSLAIVIVVVAATLYVLFLLFALSSFREKEGRAGVRALIAAHIIPMPLLISLLLFPAHNYLVSMLIIIVLILFTVLILIPLRRKVTRLVDRSFRYDERDTMFARRDLKPDTDRYNSYYSRNSGKEKADLLFRSKPGLLSEGSAFFNPLAFASAEASFHTIAALSHLRKSDNVTAVEKEMKPNGITAFLKGMLVESRGKRCWFYYHAALSLLLLCRKEGEGRQGDNNRP